MFHDYRLLSWDMQTYELYIDDKMVHAGSFWDGTLSSKFSWGDGVSGGRQSCALGLRFASAWFLNRVPLR